MSVPNDKLEELPNLGMCFVTGGSGFLGRTLIKFITEQKIGEVCALVRSDTAAEAATKAGATKTVRGDLSSSVATLAELMKGCDYCFHLAAAVSPWWGNYRESYASNVDGTQHIIDACRAAGVKRMIHCSTEATLLGPGPLKNANETHPYGSSSKIYPITSTKAEAERRVVAAGKATESDKKLNAVVCRPRFIWGLGDTVILQRLGALVKEGKWAWIGGGNFLTSTCHVRNVCEGLVRAADKGQSGEIYFLTDGTNVITREWITAMMATQDVKVPQEKSVGYRTAMGVAATMEYLWWMCGCCCKAGSEPPMCRQVVKLMGEEITVNDSKARKELGYVSHVSRELGLQELKQAHDAEVAAAPKS